jgi:hypothetical protein
MNDKTIEGLAKKLADSLPGGVRAMRDDLERGAAEASRRAGRRAGLELQERASARERAITESRFEDRSCRRAEEPLAALP